MGSFVDAVVGVAEDAFDSASDFVEDVFLQFY